MRGKPSAYIKLKYLSIAIQTKIVTTDNVESNTTIRPASSSFVFAFCAVVKFETAVGATNIAIKAESSIPLNSNWMLINRKIAGMAINFPITENLGDFYILAHL